MVYPPHAGDSIYVNKASQPCDRKENSAMHNAIIAIVFIGMLLAPCVVTIFRSNEDEA